MSPTAASTRHAHAPLPTRDARVRAVAAEFFRVRPLVVAPCFALSVAVLAASGARPAQVLGLGCGGALLVGFFFFERSAARRRPVDSTWTSWSLRATLVGLGVACVATGGIVSPLLPLLFAPLGVGFAALGGTRKVDPLYALFGGVVALLFAVAPVVHPLAVAETPRRIMLGLAMLASSLLLRVGVGGLTQAHARTAEALGRAGDELVRGAEARTRALETLGARVAHEVKNPLAAVRALVEVMLESADDRGRRRLEVAATEISRIQRVVEGYAALSHPLDVVRPAPTDVVELVTSLAAMLEPRASLVGAELSVSLGAGLGPHFPLDGDRVREALLNLSLNALDAVQGGARPGRVTLALGGDAAGLVIRVQDTGVGMDAKTLERLGTPFFSLRPGGTGLGVAHARQVVEQHGGALTYESRPGVGTVATLRLPSGAAGPCAPSTGAPS